MKLEKLSEFVIELESGTRPKGGVSVESGTIPSLGAEHLNKIGGFNFHKNKYISKDFFQRMKTGIIKKNDILIVKDGATTGKISYVNEDFPYKKASINEHVFRLSVDSDKAFSKYFYSFLKTTEGKKQILKDHRGATVGGISRKFINLVKIPIPENYADQVRIAGILSRAEGLIEKRKESIRLLDEFLKSTFLEMFGDPVRNEKGWERIPLSEILIKIESGQSPVCLKEPAPLGEWGVLKLGAITKCVFNPIENKALPDEQKSNPDIEIKVGDVLFSRKNTYDLVAACAYVWETPPKLMMPDLIFRLVPNDKDLINSIFLQALLSFPSKRKKVQKLAGGAAGSMPNISKTKLLAQKIEVPPLSLQNQFASIVEKVETIKAKYQVSLEELERLYGSLSQRAFKGELDLSGVVVK